MTALAWFNRAIVRSALGALAPAGARARLSTLIFHRVLERPDPLNPGEVTAADFEQILIWCKEVFNVLPIAEAMAGLRSGRLPARPLVITFDDGYADNHDLAAPLLGKHGLPAVFFIASGYLDGGRMFNDDVGAAIAGCPRDEIDLTSLGLGRHTLRSIEERRHTLGRLLPAVKSMPLRQRDEVVTRLLELAGVRPPPGLMMTSDQVASLRRKGFEIGAHTHLHPILATLDPTAVREEIRAGRRCLEEIIGAPVRYFAYPNGRPGEDFTTQTVQVVRESGFEAAYSTTPGVATRETDPFQLPRFTPWDRSPLMFALRMGRNLLHSRSLTAEAAVGLQTRRPASAWNP